MLSARTALYVVFPPLILSSFLFGLFAIEYSFYLFPGADKGQLWTKFFAAIVGRWDYAFGPGSVHYEMTETYTKVRGIMMLHTIFGGIQLMIGPFQFIQQVRVGYPMIHRAMGGLYILLQVIFLPFQMAYFIIVKPKNYFTGTGFSFALIGLWLLTAASLVLALIAIRSRDFVLHSAFMSMNYAMLSSAVMLRYTWIVAGWMCPTCTVTDINQAVSSFILPFLMLLSYTYISCRSPVLVKSVLRHQASAGFGFRCPSVIKLPFLLCIVFTILVNLTQYLFRFGSDNFIDLYAAWAPAIEREEWGALLRTHWIFALAAFVGTSMAMICGFLYLLELFATPRTGLARSGHVVGTNVVPEPASVAISSDFSSTPGYYSEEVDDHPPPEEEQQESSQGAEEQQENHHVSFTPSTGEGSSSEDWSFEALDILPMAPAIWPHVGGRAMADAFTPYSFGSRVGVLYYFGTFLGGLGLLVWWSMARNHEAYGLYAATFYISWVITWWVVSAITFVSALYDGYRHVEWATFAVAIALVPVSQLLFYGIFTAVGGWTAGLVGSTTIAFGWNVFLAYVLVGMTRYRSVSLRNYWSIWTCSGRVEAAAAVSGESEDVSVDPRPITPLPRLNTPSFEEYSTYDRAD